MASILVRDIEATDTRVAGWWCAANGQGSMDMTGMTLSAARDMLLAECGEDEQREGILDGTLEIV